MQREGLRRRSDSAARIRDLVRYGVGTRGRITVRHVGLVVGRAVPKDGAFADALSKGLTRFANMIGAKKIDLAGVKPAKLKSELKTLLKRIGF